MKRLLLLCIAMIVLAAPTPIAARSIFMFGGQIEHIDALPASLLHSANMQWVKIQVFAPDSRAFTLLSQAHNAGFKVLFSAEESRTTPTDESNQQQYIDWLVKLSQAGADGIEIWNEENYALEWANPDPVAYVTLLKRVYLAVKQANPDTLIVTGGLMTTGVNNDLVISDDRYFAGLAAAGAAQYSDCIGFHYEEGAISPLATRGDARGNFPTYYLPNTLARVRASFPSAKLCATEFGYLSGEGYGKLPDAFWWASSTTAAQQAQWLSVAKNYLASRVSMMIVFNVDFKFWGSDPQAGYAISRPDGSCPTCVLFAK